jgi:hypothetical protein
MGAFFADISEPSIGKVEQGIPVPNPGEEKKEKEWRDRIARLRGELNDATQIESLRAAWETTLAQGIPQAQWTALQPENPATDKKSKLEKDTDGFVTIAPASVSPEEMYTLAVKTPEGPRTQGFRLEAVPVEGLKNLKQKPAAQASTVLVNEITVLQNGKPLEFLSASASAEQKEFPAKMAVDGATKPPTNGWSPKEDSEETPMLYLELLEPLPAGRELKVQIRITNTTGKVLGKFRLSATQQEALARAPRMFYPDNIRQIVETPLAKRNNQQKGILNNHIRDLHPALLSKRRELMSEDLALNAFVNSLPKCIVSVHTDKKRTVRILPRGDWQNETGEVVLPALPGFFAKPPSDKRELTRTDLANWLVSKENPLTARVFVNRLWKQFFGLGLSKQLDDMGSQGEAPLHAELLDWLACEFMDSGWDIKHMVRLLVTSRAYRQTSVANKELLARDPMNRELARQGRWRLDAELVRDNALEAAGLLVKTVGGPSIMPYQPEGYWENLNFPRRTYVHNENPAQFRRGMYTWWQRSYVHPSMLALDAPTREECAAERARSNIPQQALVLLNDPTYVEAARNLATLIVQKGGSSPEQRVEWAFRRVLQRAPSAAEKQQLTQLAANHLVQFQTTPKDADLLMHIGVSEVPGAAPTPELAAWTSVARVLLNLHETITRS